MPKMSDATLARLIRPTGERMCWSRNAFMSHPPTVPKMSDATLTRLIRPTGSACVGHIMRSCHIQLLCPKCRMRRWRVLSDLRGRMCRPDKAFMPHPAIMVFRCNTFYPFWTSPANQRAAAITPCPKDKPPSPAGKLCGKSNVKSAR